LREAHWEDEEGRYWKVSLPSDAPDGDARIGIPIGPPSLVSLGLPLEIEVRLHNQLYSRGILTQRDAQRRRQEIRGALIGALKVDVGRIIDVYLGAPEAHRAKGR
jgi:hypothetical protein